MDDGGSFRFVLRCWGRYLLLLLEGEELSVVHEKRKKRAVLFSLLSCRAPPGQLREPGRAGRTFSVLIAGIPTKRHPLNGGHSAGVTVSLDKNGPHRLPNWISSP